MYLAFCYIKFTSLYYYLHRVYIILFLYLCTFKYMCITFRHEFIIFYIVKYGSLSSSVRNLGRLHARWRSANEKDAQIESHLLDSWGLKSW